MNDAANRTGTGQLIGVPMQPDELAAIDGTAATAGRPQSPRS